MNPLDGQHADEPAARPAAARRMAMGWGAEMPEPPARAATVSEPAWAHPPARRTWPTMQAVIRPDTP